VGEWVRVYRVSVNGIHRFRPGHGKVVSAKERVAHDV